MDVYEIWKIIIIQVAVMYITCQLVIDILAQRRDKYD